jgi:hypothetical protein
MTGVDGWAVPSEQVSRVSAMHVKRGNVFFPFSTKASDRSGSRWAEAFGGRSSCRGIEGPTSGSPAREPESTGLGRAPVDVVRHADGFAVFSPGHFIVDLLHVRPEFFECRQRIAIFETVQHVPQAGL